MTDTPDTALAALAVQLAALKASLSQTRDDLEAAKRELAARIDQVAAGLAAQAGRDPKGPPATCWPALDADAKKAALAALTEWVTLMRQWHPSYFEHIADCWASHPEVVIELHNVMTEFTRIYRMTHPLLADTLLLYDRWLPGMLRRCHDVMKTCGPAGCSQQRQLRYQALYQDIAAAHAPASARPCNPRAGTTPDQAAKTGPADNKPGTTARRR
jgi:hypothetical protein